MRILLLLSFWVAPSSRVSLCWPFCRSFRADSYSWSLCIEGPLNLFDKKSKNVLHLWDVSPIFIRFVLFLFFQKPFSLLYSPFYTALSVFIHPSSMQTALPSLQLHVFLFPSPFSQPSNLLFKAALDSPQHIKWTISLISGFVGHLCRSFSTKYPIWFSAQTLILIHIVFMKIVSVSTMKWPRP